VEKRVVLIAHTRVEGLCGGIKRLIVDLVHARLCDAVAGTLKGVPYCLPASQCPRSIVNLVTRYGASQCLALGKAAYRQDVTRIDGRGRSKASKTTRFVRSRLFEHSTLIRNR